MQFSELKVGQVLDYSTALGEKSYRGIVVAKTYTLVTILWAVSIRPEPTVYNISDTWLLERMTFYADWKEFNTVPVKTINTLNNF